VLARDSGAPHHDGGVRDPPVSQDCRPQHDGPCYPVKYQVIAPRGHVMVQFDELVRVFGPPRSRRREWWVELDGETAVIYADDDAKRPIEQVACWAVGGFTSSAVTRVAEALQLTPLQVEVRSP
jgi:hypothetical protein